MAVVHRTFQSLHFHCEDTKNKIEADGGAFAATHKEADIVLTAVVGMMGIVPTIKAIEAHKDIALANKETLVTAGHIIMKRYSPNYFDEQDGIGHRHLFFFLKDCVNSEEPNGFYLEFLDNDLMKHKRVFEALGAKCHVEDTDDQLSGIGFSMTKREDLIIKVKGATERVMKIKF